MPNRILEDACIYIYIYVPVYVTHLSDITITVHVYLHLYFTDAVVQFRYITCMRS